MSERRHLPAAQPWRRQECSPPAGYRHGDSILACFPRVGRDATIEELRAMPVSRYPVRRRVLPAAVVASIVSIAAASQSAPAQAPEAPPAAAWRVECSGDGKVLECRAVQQVFHRETRQLLLSVAVRTSADGKSGEMLVTLALGLNVSERVAVKIYHGTRETPPH